MNFLKTLALATLALAASLSFAAAETFSQGSIKKLDAKARKVTIIHEELVGHGMPAMTMVFRATAGRVAQLAEGKEIAFLADRVNGKLTVTALK
ncbi:copper-binding protein [Pseudorhodobacter wandonensis]|uniref:copper-binding protein n=1 Tax=Pseudorhodobacter wandonensis TaxID=1120568 RepID=UPI00067D0A60